MRKKPPTKVELLRILSELVRLIEISCQRYDTPTVVRDVLLQDPRFKDAKVILERTAGK
jgi:hypothetical protein